MALVVVMERVSAMQVGKEVRVIFLVAMTSVTVLVTVTALK